ncbi:iron/zinc/copper transport system ATP-binding protein [Granulicatella balaenopterae]|uniref:Iron/zinc/copper transport system ATP-binding protein n=1 Tax=Granulicatella balaenopterae TaxID=137733 RepID=A0A1H9JDN4_9LACT|nr:metal ABC transporter ATP-binding protein [Granulicatella balaenopterae]SEQ84839.1 iron/zinc/copper transport system ATP-binding protein [Granulicatella balaenopterae]
MIECRDVSVIYQNSVKALENISFSLEGPTITGIIGPNGAGKSTLLKAILHIIRSEGMITIDGVDSRKKLKDVAYVEQKSAIDFTFPITVEECVSLGTYSRVGILKKLGQKEWDDVHKALEMVGLVDFKKRQIGELSGGQFQRVLLARCLVQDTKYIFLDEPFVGIDLVSEQIIVSILNDLKKQGKTIVIVHHDLGKVKQYFDQVIILNKKLIAVGNTEEVFNKVVLKEAYGEKIFVE